MCSYVPGAAAFAGGAGGGTAAAAAGGGAGAENEGAHDVAEGLKEKVRALGFNPVDFPGFSSVQV